MSSLEENLAGLVYEQRKLMELIEALYNEINVFQRSLVEHQNARDILNFYKRSESKESETLLPVGGGVYLPVNITTPNKVIVGVGAGVFLEKTVEEAVQYVDSSINNLKQALDDRAKSLEELKNKYEEISAAIAELQFKLRQTGRK